MNQPLNPVQIEQRIQECADRIARGVMVVSDAHRAFLEADRAFDRAFAVAYVEQDGPVHMREKVARIQTMGLREARDLADVIHQQARRQWQAIVAELDALRSIGASVRASYATGGGS